MDHIIHICENSECISVDNTFSSCIILALDTTLIKMNHHRLLVLSLSYFCILVVDFGSDGSPLKPDFKKLEIVHSNLGETLNNIIDKGDMTILDDGYRKQDPEPGRPVFPYYYYGFPYNYYRQDYGYMNDYKYGFPMEMDPYGTFGNNICDFILYKFICW